MTAVQAEDHRIYAGNDWEGFGEWWQGNDVASISKDITVERDGNGIDLRGCRWSRAEWCSPGAKSRYERPLLHQTIVRI
jgi:hypothetical protein